MLLRHKRLLAIGVASIIGLVLFTTGLHYPPEARVRGDAYHYLLIASQLGSVESLFTYAGDRTIGLPFFEYVIKKFLGDHGEINMLQWVDAICLTLFLTHIVTAWFFSTWARKTNLLKSNNAVLLLFVFLATFPALIGHTTSPLSDTLAIDLLLCGVVSAEAALSKNKIYGALLFSAAAGLFFGFSMLVRPGSAIALAIASAFALLIAALTGRRTTIVICTSILACIALIAPSAYHCEQKYGKWCQQNPSTFNAVASAQAGLKGARTVWNKGGINPAPEGVPTLPDSIMFNNYYHRCHLSSIVGLGDTSLTGCLLARPLALPAYVVKKWIGLFDHFRFTPYLEDHTPTWLLWLSRAYDSIAWAGLALAFVILIKVARRPARHHLKNFLISNITPVVLGVYSVVMLAQHTILHTEDRYGFPLIPLCTVIFFNYGEAAVLQLRLGRWPMLASAAIVCLVAVTIFITQIVSWDQTVFY